jgi:outer membrane protein
MRIMPSGPDNSQMSAPISVPASSQIPSAVTSQTLQATSSSPPASSGKEKGSSIFLRPRIEQTVVDKPFTLRGAVEYAQTYYPNVLKSQSQVRAAKRNVTIQKINEYMPDSLFQYQEILASHNKLTQVFFGSPVFPAISGPATTSNTLRPLFFASTGVSLDWAPLDFGLHKARIQLAKTLAEQSKTQYSSTELDVGLTAANAFLDAVISVEQVKAAEQNVLSFEQFSQVVQAQVTASLKPGADESLAQAQLANARNDLIRAQLSRDLAFQNLANAIGLGGKTIDINSTGISERAEPADVQRGKPVFEEVPILQAANAVLLSTVAQKKVLDKEYFPVFHLLTGFNLRGSGLSKTVAGEAQSANASGVFPVIPNYQVAIIVNWNFLDIFRLHQEKKVQSERIYQQQQETELVMQNLRTQDAQSRSRVKAALALAENMPVQVKSAVMATQQAEARYRTGLGSVAQVAQANETLAQSRVQEAIARIGVWRALLSVASVHGDIRPLLSESDRVQKGM